MQMIKENEYRVGEYQTFIPDNWRITVQQASSVSKPVKNSRLKLFFRNTMIYLLSTRITKDRAKFVGSILGINLFCYTIMCLILGSFNPFEHHNKYGILVLITGNIAAKCFAWLMENC